VRKFAAYALEKLGKKNIVKPDQEQHMSAGKGGSLTPETQDIWNA
jgi:hypothetical protein